MSLVLEENKSFSPQDLMGYSWISGDPNPIHFDPEVAKKRGLPRLIVHGMLVYCVSFRLLSEKLKATSAGLRIYQMTAKFSAPIFIEDPVRFELEDASFLEKGALAGDEEIKIKLKVIGEADSKPRVVFNIRLRSSEV